MKTTLSEIYKLKPEIIVLAKLLYGLRFLENIPFSGIDKQYRGLTEDQKNQEIDLKFILENSGVEDCVWTFQTQDYKDYCLILADIAESVLPIYESKHLGDKRVRNCIQGIRDYKAGKISKEKLEKLTNLAEEAEDTAYDRSSGKAAEAAIYAAKDIAWAAEYVAREAAYSYYYQLKKNEQILRSYL